MTKQEGNVDYFRGTPLATADGVPATFWRTAISPFTRWKYGVILERVNGDKIAWFDKDGAAQDGTARLRNAVPQTRWEIVGKALVFYHKSQALAYANSAGLASPEGVVEAVIGENGRVISRKLLE